MLRNTSLQALDSTIASRELAKAFAISNSLLMAKNILVQGNLFFLSINSFLTTSIMVISAVLYLLPFLRFSSVIEIRKSTIVLSFALIIIWMYPICTDPSFLDARYVKIGFTSFLSYGFPGFVLLSLLKDCDVLLETFYKLRWLLFSVSFLSVVLILVTGFEAVGDTYSEYSMALGGNMIFPAFIFISAWFRNRKIYDLFGMLFLIFSILIFASRYPLVCIAVFLGIELFRTAKSSRNRVFTVVSVIFVVALSPFYQSMLSRIYEVLLEKTGIRSRTLSLLFEGNMGSDSGRWEIHKKLLEAINESPIFGYGAAGGSVALDDGLAHSFVLDVFASFGYIFGALILVVSAFVIIRLYRNNRRWSNREYILMCLCAFLPICFFQRSFFTAQYYWYLLGMACGGMTGVGIADSKRSERHQSVMEAKESL